MTMKNSLSQSCHSVFISSCAAIGAFLFGYDTGVLNGAMKGLSYISNNNLISFSLSVASMMLGCAVGAFYAGRLADIYGRRFMMQVISVLFIVSSFGVGFVDSATLFIFYRVIGGICVGAISILVPMYIAEISAAFYRGRLGAIQNMMVILGLCAAFLSNYILVEISGGSLVVFWLGFETWRWMLWGELLPAILFFIMLFFVPESPRYLVIAGKNAEASQVLTRLFGQLAGEAKLMDIIFSLTGQDQPKLKDLKNKRTGKVQHVLWLGLGLAIFQQLVGVNIFYYYGVLVFESIGFNESDAIFINVVGAIFSFVASIISMLFIDKWGRKKLLFVGSIGILSCLVFLAFTLFQIEKESALPFLGIIAYANLAVLIVYLYLIFFNLSWGPVMWVMLGEIFPNQIRGSGLAVAGLVHWLTNFIVTMSFPLLFFVLGGSGLYLLYSVIVLIAIYFVYCLYETKGQELEDMPY